MRRSKTLLLGSISALALLLSCVDGTEPISPEGRGNVRIPLAAQLQASPADESALPINRIRAVARAVPGGQVIGEATVTVDPAATSWQVPLELTLEGLVTEVVVEIALINVDAAGVESIQYSGRVGPLTVRPGQDTPPVDVPVVRGPPGNLAVTAVDITNAAPALVEAGTRTLQATVTTNPAGTATTTFWTSLTPTLLSFNGAVATALLPGTARVVATAGPVSDTADIQILPRPARVTVTPASTSVELGSEVTFTGAVLDPRGAAIAGQAVLWRSLDPSVLEAVANGRFRTVGSGTGRAEARAAADTTLKAVGTVLVTRRAVDVAVTKTTPTTSALVGDPVVYTVAVANLGDVEAAAVAVRDQLPTGLTLESSQASAGTFNAATSTWSVGNLAAGARATLELRTRLDAGTPGTVVSNTAEKIASAVQTDPNTANDRSTATFAIAERTVDLSVQKTASRATVAEGDTVRFTVTVSNTGPGTVTGLAVADTLPAGMSLVSDQATRGSFAGGLRSWAIGTLAAGESAQLSVLMRANAGSGGSTQTNVARILSYDGPRESNAGNNRAAAAVTVQTINAADVALTKVAALGSVLEGDTASFTVTVKNLGPNAAGGVEVKDSLPTGLTYVSSPAPARGTFSSSTMVWTVGTLAVGDSALLTVRAVVGAGTNGQTLTNYARYLAAGPNPDNVSSNNSAWASVNVVARSANVEVVKVVDVANPVELAPVRFTITTTNLGPNPVTNLRIKDRLPSGLVLDSIRTTTGTVAGDTLWTIPSLAVSSSAVMSVYVRVNAVSGTTLVNQATRVGMDQSDPVSSNDVGTASITVQRRNLDLQVRKTASVAQPTVTSAFSYRVVVTNRGPGSATSVVVADTLPTQLTVDSVRTSLGSFAASAWTVGTLAQGDSAVMTVYVRVPQAASGQTITNRARRLSQAQNDTNVVNDTSTVRQTVPVNNPPVVTISAPPNQAVFDPGDTITFTATATDPEDGTLTNSIVWTSNVSGAMGTGGTVTRFNLAPGPHLVIASVTDSNNNVSADTVPIVIAIVTTPTSLNVPFGGTASLPISLSAPAPSGGLVLTITSEDATRVGVVTSSVTIPAGALSANAQLSGVAPGSTRVTASTQGFGSSTTSVSVTAALNVAQNGNPTSFVSFPRGFTTTIQVRLESQGTQIAAPSGGVSVTLTPAVPTCVSVTSPITIPAGQVSGTATLSYGGSGASPCTSPLTATATSITSDSITVQVNASPAVTLNPFTFGIGSGLETSNSGFFDYSQHGGVTVRITSTNPALLRVSPNNTTVGTTFIDLPLANGFGSFSYHIQGIEGATGTASLIATAPGFAPDTIPVNVVQPRVQLSSFSTSHTSLSPDVQFYAYVGVDGCCGTLNQQSIRPGGTPVTATFTTSDTARVRVKTSSTSGASVTATIPVGQYFTPTSLATGGVALDFVSAGTANVSVSIPGFVQHAQATRALTITAPGINSAGAVSVGASLQANSFASLGAAAHGGVTVRVESSDPTRLRIAPNATTLGTGFIDLVLADGQTSISYFVQGVPGTTGTALVRYSAPGFVADSATVTIVQPIVRLSMPGSSFTTLNPDAHFYVMVGPSEFAVQVVNPLAGPLTATVASSDSTKARLVKTADSGDTVTVTIPVGEYLSPSSVAAGGVALDFLAAGTTTITASIPGFTRAPSGTANVTVTAPGFSPGNATVGAGLQVNGFSYLGASDHGGVTVTLTSSDGTRLLLSPNATTAGTGSITVVVPNGATSVSYHVQGVAGTTGTARVRMSAPGFTPDSATVTIVQPGVTFVSLPSSTTTLSANSSFQVYVGIPGCCTGGLSPQAVRAGGTALTATINAAPQGVGQIVTAAGSSTTGTVTIPVGAFNSNFNDAAFDPIGAGTTRVTVTIPGFAPTPTGTVDVVVSSPGITVSPRTVGAGLMEQSFISLGASGHGGVTLRIRSSSGAIALVSANSSTVGTDSVDIVVPAGSQTIQFWVHGVEGRTGTVTFTASAPGFTDGSAAMTIVQPGVQVSLTSSISATAQDQLFYIYIGTPSGNGVSPQVLRAGAPALVATVTSSQPSIGTLVTSAGASASRTVTISAGSYLTPGSVGAGGIAFDPIAQGSTNVNATIPGYVQTTAATQTVNVGP